MAGSNRLKQAAVLSVSMLSILCATAVSPALSGIKNAFPEIPDSTIQLVMGLPTMCIIPTCFLCRPLIRRLGEKSVLLIGVLLYTIGGTGAAFMPTFGSMLAMRALLGIACGLTIPMAQVLISSNFEGKEREHLTAYSASASYLMGIVAAFAVGRLALINWRLCFSVYLFALIVFFLNLSVELASSKGSTQQKKRGRRPDTRAVISIAVMALVNLAFYTFTSSISLFMREEALGDSGRTGLIVSVFMVSGFLTGLIAPQVKEKTGEYNKALGFLLMGSGYLVLLLSESQLPLFLSGILIGASYSILYAAGFSEIRTFSRDKEENTALITVMTSAMFFGQAVSVYVLKGAELLFGFSGYRFRFALIMALLLLGAILSAAAASRRIRYGSRTT